MKEFEQVIQIRPQEDAFDDVRMEYAKMLKQQLAKGNNGLVKSKYITFAIEAENIREAKPKLERIESDILCIESCPDHGSIVKLKICHHIRIECLI